MLPAKRKQDLSPRMALAKWTLFDLANAFFLTAVAALCVVPIIHMFALSLSSPAAAAGRLVGLWPVDFATTSYRAVLTNSVWIGALFVSLQRTFLGTIISMVLTIITAYPLSRPRGEMRGRQLFLWVLVFAFLFDGGLIPWFLVIRRLHLLNTIWALVLPDALRIWNVILLIGFFSEVPVDLSDAAAIDGASHWRRLESIYIPMSRSAIATLTLFTAVHHWNAWFDGMVLIWDGAKYPLQTMIRAVLPTAGRAHRATLVMVGMLPILLIYPLLLRYFVEGTKIGALKG